MRRLVLQGAALAIVCIVPLITPHAAFGHADDVDDDRNVPHNYHDLLTTWEWDPGVVAPLLLSGVLYGVGLARLWRAAGVGHGIHRWQAACFIAGWFSLLIALVSPLHPWGEVLFWPHMVQHEILMLIAAPLLVLGQPMAVFLHALPIAWSRRLARLGNNGSWLKAWRFITLPFVAWIVHGLALWCWHIPALFEATLHNDFIHALQHLSFLLTALLFWWAVIHGSRNGVAYGVAVLYMFTTAMHSGLLGALLTFATTAWYPSYAKTAAQWNVSPLEDQQLGGLIMWVPAGLVYVAVGLALFAAWLHHADRRNDARRNRLAAQVDADPG